MGRLPILQWGCFGPIADRSIYLGAHALAAMGGEIRLYQLQLQQRLSKQHLQARLGIPDAHTGRKVVDQNLGQIKLTWPNLNSQ